MIEGRQLVCLSSLPWHGRPTSRHHLVRILAGANDVLFVDPPTNALRERRLHGGRLHDEEPRIRRLEPAPHLPFGGTLRFSLTTSRNQRAYAASVAEAVGHLGWSEPVLWTSFPVYFSPLVADALRPAVHFLHMTDLLWEFPHYRPQYDAFLARIRARCDFAVASTEQIARRLTEEGFDCHHLPHGVDLSHFQPALERTAEPIPALQGLERPMIGFAGRLDRRLDLDAVVGLAAGGPGTTVLVGPSILRPQEMRRLREAGCVLPGEVGYAELPRWLAGFDVALLPYRPLASVVPSRPLKLLEYLASGLPVVSTDIPAAAELAPHVITASDPRQFGPRVEDIWSDRSRALGDPARRRRAAAAAPHSWERRAAELGALVTAAMRRRGATKGGRP